MAEKNPLNIENQEVKTEQKGPSQPLSYWKVSALFPDRRHSRQSLKPQAEYDDYNLYTCSIR